MEQSRIREQHLQADLDSARQQSYNMTVEARQEKAKADRLRAVNAKLVNALERISLHAAKAGGYAKTDDDTYELAEDFEGIEKWAREAVEEANK